MMTFAYQSFLLPDGPGNKCMFFLFLLVSLNIVEVNCSEQQFDAITPDTLIILSSDSLDVSWQIIEPMLAAYDNIGFTENRKKLSVDSLGYIVTQIVSDSSLLLLIPGEDIPEYGTFYVAYSSELSDTIYSLNPIQLVYPNIVQISLRPDDSYLGFLYELLNTPFIMAPRNTPHGSHQADFKLGTDCAGLAVYGKRRMGFDYQYLGPRGIIQYLTPVGEGSYYLDSTLYVNLNNGTMTIGESGIVPGDILHFGTQVSIFLVDRGVIGFVDVEDLLIQSWFTGTHICTIRDSGYFDRSIRFFKWRL